MECGGFNSKMKYQDLQDRLIPEERQDSGIRLPNFGFIHLGVLSVIPRG